MIPDMEPNTTAERMGRVFREAREAKGWSLDEATFQARLRFRRLRISRAKIHRLEAGIKDRDRLDLSILIALCALYGLRYSDIDPAGELGIAEEIGELQEVAALNSPCIYEPPDPPELKLAVGQ